MNKDRIALIRGFRATAPDPKIVEAKAKFEAFNEFVQRGGGWVTSVPGATEVRWNACPIHACRTISAVGYDVREIGDGERILAHRIVERFVRRADGELEPVTEGSTKPIAETRTHAGIVKVRRYGFDMPDAHRRPIGPLAETNKYLAEDHMSVGTNRHLPGQY